MQTTTPLEQMRVISRLCFANSLCRGQEPCLHKLSLVIVETDSFLPPSLPPSFHPQCNCGQHIIHEPSSCAAEYAKRYNSCSPSKSGSESSKQQGAALGAAKIPSIHLCTVLHEPLKRAARIKQPISRYPGTLQGLSHDEPPGCYHVIVLPSKEIEDVSYARCTPRSVHHVKKYVHPQRRTKLQPPILQGTTPEARVLRLVARQMPLTTSLVIFRYLGSLWLRLAWPNFAVELRLSASEWLLRPRAAVEAGKPRDWAQGSLASHASIVGFSGFNQLPMTENRFAAASPIRWLNTTFLIVLDVPCNPHMTRSMMTAAIFLATKSIR
ncbi:hypothetical protein HCEG_06783 [Histoplasma capsulatum var. duboisii H88]|nr:hypothetical protein HCEG_06783 [Histoplasma capsulatum var. duboisii H88]